MKTQTRVAPLAITVLALLAVNRLPAAVAEEPETIDITFVLNIHLEDLTDEDSDGIPELPPLTGNELVGVAFKPSQNTAGASLTFAETSAPCGPFDVAGVSWTGPSPAMLVGKKGPTGADCFGSGLHPPERGFLQASKVIASHACWYKIVSGVLYTQTGYDEDTNGAVVIMTGEFRLNDLF